MKGSKVNRIAIALVLVALLSHEIYGAGPAASVRSEASLVPLKYVQVHLRGLTDDLLAGIPDLRPVDEDYPETSPFGMRQHPILHDSILHAGMDFGAPEGARIFATADGIVKSVSALADSSTYGICVVIEHPYSELFGETYSTLYAHMSKAQVRKGQRIKKGQIIGRVGNTGRSTDYHLHYEVHMNDTPVDPRPFLPTAIRQS